MMAGEGGQDLTRILVGDYREAVCKALRRAVKFRSKFSVLFAIRLKPPIHAGHLSRDSANKQSAPQIRQSPPILGRKPVLLRKRNVTTHLAHHSLVKLTGEQVASVVRES